MNMLSASNIHYSYNSHPVLRGVDLEVERGERLALVVSDSHDDWMSLVKNASSRHTDLALLTIGGI